MNSIDERDSDSFRSSVSSPGIPNTCLTPSASRHSTKTSDARRLDTGRRLPGAASSLLWVGVPTRYTKSGDLHIAYQAVGEGDTSLVYIPTWIGQLEVLVEEPSVEAFLQRVCAYARLISFDRRGAGLSDPWLGAPTLEEQMDDVLAVMDATGTERGALMASLEGGPLAMLFAATHPDRVSSLILYCTFARARWAPDYDWAGP